MRICVNKYVFRYYIFLSDGLLLDLLHSDGAMIFLEGGETKGGFFDGLMG